MSRPYPAVRLRYLAQFNPPVPSKVSSRPRATWPLLPMEDIGNFRPPTPAQRRTYEVLSTGYSYLEPTDLAYAKVTPCFENGKGLSGADLEGPTFATTEVSVLRPRPAVSQRFLTYVVQSEGFRSAAIASMTGAGGLRRVSEADIKNYPVPSPNVEVQNQIADYLDHETAEIDALISNLSDFATLLDERLPSAVQHHVLRALAVAYDRKPTTKEPRGRFNAPVHPFAEQWTSLGYLAGVETGSMDTQDSQPDGEYPFFVRSDTVERTHSYTFDQEAILTAGDGAGVGKVFHHFQGKFAAHQRVYVITPRKVNGAFLYWVLRGYFGPIILGGTAKSTVESLRRPMLTGFPVPDLSMQQQVEIARTMNSEQNYVDLQITNVHRGLSLARERRAALITAAVTGQIDVTARNKPAAEQLEDDIAQDLHREN